MNNEINSDYRDFYIKDIKRRIAVGAFVMASVMAAIGTFHTVEAINDASNYFGFNPNINTTAQDYKDNSIQLSNSTDEGIKSAEALGLSALFTLIAYKSYRKYRES